MSGVKRTEDFHSIKTRSVVIQNADNTFPPIGSVLAADDSRGHMAPTRSLYLDEIVIKNNNLTIDSFGNITAKTITLDSSANAITSAGDITVTNANILMSGDQNLTGYISTTYVDLLDLSANDQDTYLFANAGNLLWQNDNLTINQNISQAVLNQYVDISSQAITLPTDLPSVISTLNNLLRIFNSRQMFIGISGEQPGGGSSGNIANVPIYTVCFNSICGMIIRFIDVTGQPIPGIGDFIYYANANSGVKQYSLNNLCVNMQNTINNQGTKLSDHMLIQYLQSSATVRITVKEPGWFAVFLDISRVGEATRFLNHLGFLSASSPAPPSMAFGPPANQPLIIPPTFAYASQYVPYAINGFISGYSFTGLRAYLNNDKALLSPTYSISLDALFHTLTITVTAHPSTTGLTAPSSALPGTGNVFGYYGIYLNGVPIFIKSVTNPPPSVPFIFNVDISPYILLAGDNTVAVSSIDQYNGTITPTKKTFFVP